MRTGLEWDSPIGKLGLVEEEEKLAEIRFEGLGEAEGIERKETVLLKETVSQLADYFGGGRTEFTVPLLYKGTDFQVNVWKALVTIPYGEVRTYGQIAAQIGKPKACRAVGMANHVNRLPIVIPCHRVIGSSGSLVGYGGGLRIKEFLLALEQQKKSGQRK